MDFEKILKQWESEEFKTVSPPRKTGGGKAGSSWLDRYPPGAEAVALKEAEMPVPVSEGRSVWKRRPHQDTLDLHGMKGSEAELSMERFIASMRRRGLRKGLVIHGKGIHSPEGSVLSPLVRRFLEKSDEVGAFGKAARKDGGSGATWFLLRQRSR